MSCDTRSRIKPTSSAHARTAPWSSVGKGSCRCEAADPRTVPIDCQTGGSPAARRWRARTWARAACPRTSKATGAL
eukprot:6901441-Pyramimonas_sp.AAC.1